MFTKYLDPDKALERVGTILVGNVHESWVEIQADVELLPDDIVKTSHFYRPGSNPSQEKPLHIASGFEHMELSDCFQQLATLTSTPAKGLFKKSVYRLLNTGKYTVEYQY